VADVFQRHLGKVLELQPKQYTTADGRVSIRCPVCGSIDTIKPETIDPSGLVARRYTCLTVTCPYAEYVQLESWGAA
jgi:hypothetical protein